MKSLPRRNAYAVPVERAASPFEVLLTLVVCFLLVCAAAYASGGAP